MTEARRYARYAEAVSSIVGYPSEAMVKAVMAVADAELKERDQPDPLVGRRLVCVSPETGRVIAAGRVTEVDRDGGGLSLALVQYESAPPNAHGSAVDPATLPEGMNWRDHLGD
ncbi:hypothetical protein ACN2WE_05010 [Streptomyces sp. cg28]|uniref:hypothetical protein n=1 Tax=Streptomyces sp. cg28 TaxID=3403457 RepID=UPI003B220A91